MFESFMQPLATFISHNSHLGALISGLIACAESMAVIGTLIPGSVTMTLIGSLLGSGILPAKLTISYIIIGAFIGDYISYWLGIYYKDSIRSFRIMKKYVHWLDYGEKFVAKHGVASIIIGRFFGPMRSMVPLVAGVLAMSRTKFILGALPSVILWAFLYLTPGIILGAFAMELPTDLALKLISIVLFIIAAIVAISYLYKYIILTITKYSNLLAGRVVIKLKEKPNWFSKYFLTCKVLAPTQIVKAIYLIPLFVAVIMLIYSVIASKFIMLLDVPIFKLMTSIYEPGIYKIMLLISYLGEKAIIIPAIAIMSLYLIWQRQYRLFKYSSLVVITTSITVTICKYIIQRPRPLLTAIFTEPYSFPSGHIALSTAVFAFFAMILCRNIDRYKRVTVYQLLMLCLILIGFSRIYLAAHWLSDILFGIIIGLIVANVHIIFYHRKKCTITNNNFIYIFTATFFLFYLSYCSYFLPTDFQAYQPKHYIQENISSSLWWKNADKVDTIRENRFGTHVYPLNIQWLANDKKITIFLKDNGWQQHYVSDSFIDRIIHIIDEPSILILPIITKLYKGNKPKLIFSKKNGNGTTVITLWPSYVKVLPKKTPLLLGTIYQVDNTDKILSRNNTKDYTFKSMLTADSSKLDLNVLPHKINTKESQHIEILQIKFR